jgi:hypothetical protein
MAVAATPPPLTPGGVRTRRAAAAAEAAEAAAATPQKGRRAAAADGAASIVVGRPASFAAKKPLLRLAARSAVLSWLAAVWIWHLTPAASVLPGASGYLWFCRYLTFYAFSLQLAAQALAVAHDGRRLWLGGAAPSRAAAVGAKGNKADKAPHRRLLLLARWADDLGCSVFCFAHVVTLMFHAIQSATGGRAVEGAHIDRPPWLDASVHRLNVAAAWLDVAVLTPRGGRSFSRSGERASALLASLYCALLLAARLLNGAFPYPFMNAMAQPKGYLVVCGVGLLIFVAAFKLGRLVAGGIRAAEDWAVARVEEAGGRWEAGGGGGCGGGGGGGCGGGGMKQQKSNRR